MEKPILFNTDMVKAILEGRKTQTRRLIKPITKKACGFYVTFRQSDNAFTGVYDYDENERMFENSHTPPCQIGDILWIRETWANTWTPNGDEGFIYKADGKPNSFPYWGNSKQCKDEVWIPSIHMPKEAARIFLRVSNVRVEKLLEITDEEALREGFEDVPEIFTAKELFQAEWNSIYKNWDENPWVWVIEFERIDKTKI